MVCDLNPGFINCRELKMDSCLQNKEHKRNRKKKNFYYFPDFDTGNQWTARSQLRQNFSNNFFRLKW